MVTFHGFKVFFCVRILISNCGISSVLSGWKKLNSNVAKLFVYSININWPSSMIWNIKNTRDQSKLLDQTFPPLKISLLDRTNVLLLHSTYVRILLIPPSIMSCLFRNWCSKCSRMAGEVAKIRLKGTNTRSSTVLPVALKCSATAFRAPLLISDLWPFSLSAGVWPLEPRYWRASDPVFLIQKRDASICCFFMTKICPKSPCYFRLKNLGPIFLSLSSL